MKALRSTETSVTLHQSTGRNRHQHLCENVIAHRIEDHVGPVYCVRRVFYASVTIVAAFTKPHTEHIFHSVHYDILKLCNANNCTILQSMYYFSYV